MALASWCLYGLAGVGLATVVGVSALRVVEWAMARGRRSNFDISGKVVLITGASSGIGEALALECAKKNAKLFLVARRVDRVRSVAEACARLGAEQVEVFQGDVSVRDDNKRMIATCIQAYGRLDVLVLNAGSPCNVLFNDLKESELDWLRQVYDVNYWGCVDATFYALPYLRESKGMIVPISSLSTRGNTPGRTIYASSKAALNTFFHNLRTEVSKDGIDICVVQPGYIMTEFHDKAQSDGRLQKNASVFMSAEKCATLILNAVSKCEREYQMGGTIAAFGPAIQTFAPYTHDHVALKKAQAGVVMQART